MSSAFTKPILIPTTGDALTLERVVLSGAGATDTYDEKWLQKLVYEHPSALPVGDINRSFSDMRPVCREMPTQAGPIDVVYVTPDGRPIIVEAKLWRNPEARRKVIGQILDYAKELSKWDFTAFDAAVRQARRAQEGEANNGLLEIMGIGADTPAAADFHDALTGNLRRGEIMLLIIGDGIRENVGAITNFLEGHASLHFTFGLIEMAIYVMPDGGRFVQPRILTQSVILKRIVVDLRSEMTMREEDGADESASGVLDDPSPESIEERQRFKSFWTAFLKELRLDDAGQPFSSPVRAPYQSFTLSRQAGVRLIAFLAVAKGEAGVYLALPKGAIGERLYAALTADRVEIDQLLGVPAAVWQRYSPDSYYYIETKKKYEGTLIDDPTGAIKSDLANWLNRYVNVFKPRVEKFMQEEDLMNATGR